MTQSTSDNQIITVYDSLIMYVHCIFAVQAFIPHTHLSIESAGNASRVVHMPAVLLQEVPVQLVWDDL